MSQPMTAVQRRLHEAALRLFAERGSTDIPVSELSRAAGVARGTIYNNLAEPERLFEQIAAQLTEEMNNRVVASYANIADPAERMTIGIRQYIRRSHEEPHWGRFLLQFGFSNEALRGLWSGPAMEDMRLGVELGRFQIPQSQVTTAMGVLAGGTLAAILLVTQGIKTWREAGTETAAMLLQGLGLTIAEAEEIANRELPVLN